MSIDTTNHTPPRSVRVSKAIWDAAKLRAASEGETLTDVIVRALEQYATSTTKTTKRKRASK